MVEYAEEGGRQIRAPEIEKKAGTYFIIAIVFGWFKMEIQSNPIIVEQVKPGFTNYQPQPGTFLPSKIEGRRNKNK